MLIPNLMLVNRTRRLTNISQDRSDSSSFATARVQTPSHHSSEHKPHPQVLICFFPPLPQPDPNPHLRQEGATTSPLPTEPPGHPVLPDRAASHTSSDEPGREPRLEQVMRLCVRSPVKTAGTVLFVGRFHLLRGCTVL